MNLTANDLLDLLFQVWFLSDIMIPHVREIFAGIVDHSFFSSSNSAHAWSGVQFFFIEDAHIGTGFE